MVFKVFWVKNRLKNRFLSSKNWSPNFSAITVPRIWTRSNNMSSDFFSNKSGPITCRPMQQKRIWAPITWCLAFLLLFFQWTFFFIYFFKKIFIFRLIYLLSFILFRESFLNDGYFYIVRLIFKEVFLIHLYKKICIDKLYFLK
jgi:hypothetical protein